MRSLTATLTAAQKSASAKPYIKAEVWTKVGGVARFNWSRLYEGAEADCFHGATMPGPGDTSLIRIRVASEGGTLYRQRVTSTDENSDYSNWTSWGVTSYAVAICSRNAEVIVFRIPSNGYLYRCESSDSGASWGGWTDMGLVNATPADCRVAACFKSNGDAIVLYSDGVTLKRRRGHHLLQEHYESGFSGYSTVSATHWESQTFTTESAYTINKVDLRLGKLAAHTPGTVTVSIRATDGEGKPTGGDLTSGQTNGNTLAVEEWREISLTPYALSNATKYAIVVRCEALEVRWHGQTVAGTYPDGNRCYSDNAGSTWTSDTVRDLDFKCYAYEWEAEAAWTNTLQSITGIAVEHTGDWNVALTGIIATDKPGVWTCILGDGYSEAADTWSSLAELTIASAGSNIEFHAPFLNMPGVFRLFFIEKYTGSEAYSRPYWSHYLDSGDFISNLWHEPIPFNLASDYGLAITGGEQGGGDYVWLARPDGVWRASRNPVNVVVTDDVIGVTTNLQPFSGTVALTLRNDDGRYNTLGSGTNEAITKGSELRISFGYSTPAGDEASEGPRYWIEGWEYVTRGGHSELILYAADAWSLLERWRARRQFTWESGDKYISQLLSFLFARAGLEFSTIAPSTAIYQQPAFTIHPRESGLTAVKRLLDMVPDIIFFICNIGYITNPLSSDSVQYRYGKL